MTFTICLNYHEKKSKKSGYTSVGSDDLAGCVAACQPGFRQ